MTVLSPARKFRWELFLLSLGVGVDPMLNTSTPILAIIIRHYPRIEVKVTIIKVITFLQTIWDSISQIVLQSW